MDSQFDPKRRAPRDDTEFATADRAVTVLANLRRLAELNAGVVSSRMVGLVIAEGFWTNNEGFGIRQRLSELYAFALVPGEDQDNPLYTLTQDGLFESYGIRESLPDDRLLAIIAQANAPVEMRPRKRRQKRASPEESEHPPRLPRSLLDDPKD